MTAPTSWPHASGEMAERIRAFDWSRTSLGPIATWTERRRGVVDMVLTGGFPAVALLGADLVQIYNDGYRVIMGEKHPAGLGQPTRDCWPEVWHINQPIYERVRAGETVNFQDALYPITRHGALEDAWFTLSYSPLRESDDTNAGVLVTVFETTDRVRSRKTLEQSEARFRALVTAGTYSIYRMSPDWRLMYQLDSRTLAKTSGPIGDWAEKYILEEDRPRVFAAIDEAIRTRSLFELEHRVMLADGSAGWVLSRAVPLLGSDGAIAEWFGAGSDITERKLARQAQRESEALRRIALAGGGMGSWRWDLANRLVWGDERFLALWGFPPSDAAHPLSLFTARMSREGAAEMQVIVTRAIETGEEFDGPLEIVAGPTAGRWIRWRGRGDGEAPTVLYGVSFDITEQKRAEEALRESEERQAFLLKLSDALRPLDEPHEAQRAAMRILCHDLGVDRASYYEIMDDQEHFRISQSYSAADGPSADPRLRFSTLGFLFSAYRAGETLVFDDIATDPRLAGQARAEILARGVRASVVVPLVKGGRLIAMVGVHDFAPHAWTPFEIAMLQETAERTWSAVERARTEQALRVSEEKYRTLFDTMAEGFAVIELIRDASGRPFDVRYVEVNRALAQQAGLTRERLVGLRYSEAFPGMEINPWLGIYAEVEESGQPATAERYVPAADRWMEVSVQPRGETRLAVFFRDIGERKRAEFALRESEERQAFLLGLTDALRPLTDANAIAAEGTRLLGERLDADRAFLTEVGPDGITLVVRQEHLRSGASSVLGRYSFDQFGAFVARELHAGRTLAVANVATRSDLDASEKATYAGIGIGAYLLIPLVRDGRLAAYLTFNHRTPRAWSEADKELARLAAERVWADMTRARAEAALREVEEQQRLTLELVPALLWWADPTGRSITGIQRWRSYTGQTEASAQAFGWLDAIHPDDRVETKAAFERAFATGELLERQQRILSNGDGYRWHLVRHIPVRDADGTIIRWFGAAVDVDDLRRMQEEQTVMVAELHHRTRNLIGVVGMIMRQILASSASLADFQARFTERLEALSRVQSLLARPREERIGIGDIVRLELDALGADLSSDRVRIEGETVVLRKSTVQTLSLAIHELATNARKYGALHADEGCLSVRWREYRVEEGRRRLRFEWTETGIVPQIEETQGPMHKGGYGRKLIEQALPYTLKAKTAYALGRDRLECTIDMPLEA